MSSKSESEHSLSTNYSAYSCQAISSPSNSFSTSNRSSISSEAGVTHSHSCPDAVETFIGENNAVPVLEESSDSLANLASISDPSVQAALIFQWAITSGVSEAALDRLLKLLSIFSRDSLALPNSVKLLKSLIQDTCPLDDSDVSEFGFCPECKSQCQVHSPKSKVAVTQLNIVPQLRTILSSHTSTILQYEQELQKDKNTDVLNSKIVKEQGLSLSSGKSLHLHLLISADGANFFESVQSSFWPFQAQLLNLPVYIRQRFANLILIALVSSKAVPHFQSFLSEIMNNLPKQFIFSEYTVHVHYTLFVCDLPALAKLFCIHQYNGAFSCPRCLHPGESFKVSEKGKNWIFRYGEGYLFPLRNPSSHLEHCRLAQIRNRPVFGVKMRSCLLDYVPFPSCNPIDSLHCFFEGHTKYLLEELSLPANRRELYFCSANCMDFISNCIRQSITPSSITINTNFKGFSDWKAKHFKNFALYFLLPTFLQRISHFPLKLLLTNLVLIYHMLYSPQSNKTDIEKLCKAFISNAQQIFGPKVLRLNFHLLLHMAEQYELYGPVFNYSMFAFESSIGMFKKFLCGTVSFGPQLVRKFLFQKLLHHYFSCVKDSIVVDAVNSISLEPSRPHGILRNSLAYFNGHFFSTSSACASKNSNHLCQLKSGEICTIAEFLEPNTIRVQILDPIGSLFDFVLRVPAATFPIDLLNWKALLESMFKKSSTFNFVLISLSNAPRSARRERIVNFSEVDRPCIAVPVESFSKDCYCAVPLFKEFEHD
ncbi:hypothetical protein BOX15_Mlig000124g8 [Macrostomum lignano]|uniref:DUF4218 domain-containing protein n=1 Tax=Macrostomum lignano TaxID=282301 RepID=A0A267ECI1_9PLAT|nr:hypothetical protein BOX15_Mlig009268g6 [Macrostomum lignano]PAA52116.1 hypothetical protein BOX15_Mlig000124g6 [Macrostomum lignano]PAA58587.1 hypothetical protein BOX15_Mlig000124g4 [Macrostomum lignano]PAA67175.1 hypothetical protein BOX15_Mlig000124g3 [Macrostomum lignano]PAA68837.1 hypothetical protein BOX15_Mlig000124g2 [Macrostomum lignano]